MTLVAILNYITIKSKLVSIVGIFRPSAGLVNFRRNYALDNNHRRPDQNVYRIKLNGFINQLILFICPSYTSGEYVGIFLSST